jgi:hypothetical protein
LELSCCIKRGGRLHLAKTPRSLRAFCASFKPIIEGGPSEVESSAKERFMDAVDGARGEASHLVQGFRSQTNHFKAKVAVWVVYALLVVASLLWIPPPGEDNPLDARMKVDSINFGSRSKSYVEIKNQSGRAWEKATVTIEGAQVLRGRSEPVEGTWMVTEVRWRQNERRQLFVEKFRDAQDERPEMDVKITRATLEVNGVKYEKVFSGKGVQ